MWPGIGVRTELRFAAGHAAAYALLVAKDGLGSAAEDRVGAIERRILLASANDSRSSLARIAVQSGRHRLLARIKTVGSSLRLTRRWRKPDSNLYGAFAVK